VTVDHVRYFAAAPFSLLQQFCTTGRGIRNYCCCEHLIVSELNNAYITEQEYFSTGFELLSFTWQFASRSP